MTVRPMKLRAVGILAIFAACGAPALSQSRKHVGLRSYLLVGEGPSTSRTRAYHHYSFGAGDLPGQRPADGSGVLGSSMYSGRSMTVRQRAAAPVPKTELTGSPSTSRRVYTPLAPMTFSSSAGAAPPLTAYAAYLDTNQLRVTVDDVRKERKTPPPDLPKGRITSLVPRIPWEYQETMKKGEEAFRKGSYAEAIRYFQKAQSESKDSPESLLSLAHCYFALADGSYAKAADYLRLTLARFPYLALVRVHPKDFFGDKAEYAGALEKLLQHVKARPEDPEAKFVLAYLKLRDDLFPVAGRLLTEAEKDCQSPKLLQAIRLLRDGLDAARDAMLAEAPALDEPRELPWAGIRVALPKGFELQPLTEINQVLVAARGGEGTESPQSVSMSAYVVEEDVALGSFMDHLLELASQNVAIRDAKLIEEVEVPFLEGKALARLWNVKYYGAEVVLARVCFSRRVKRPGAAKQAPPLRIVYQLGMGMLKDKSEELLPAFASVARSISLTELTRPMSLPPAKEGRLIKDMEHGYAVRQPEGWAGRQTETGFEMGQIDFLLGGVVAPKAEVVTAIVPASYDSISFGERAIKKQALKGYRMEILSRGAAKLAGEDGYQFVVRKTPKPQAAEETPGAPAPKEAPYIEIGRLILLPAGKGEKRLYAIVLDCYECEVPLAEAIMDRIASTFSVLKAAEANVRTRAKAQG